jgi:protein TonB
MLGNDIFDNEWNDIVFEGKNKEYGAYQIRKVRGKNAAISIIVSVSLFVLAIAAPAIIAAIEEQFKEEVVVNTEAEVVKVEEPQPEKPEEPEFEPPPPLKTTVAYTPPAIVEDNQVNEDNMIKEIDELKDVDISTKNQQGDPDRGVDLSLLDDTGNGDKDIIDDGENDKPFTSVEQMPRFPGGEDALLDWLRKNTVYPAAARENGIEGTVIVQFTVDKDGDIKDAHVVRKVHSLLDDAAMGAVRKMPNWSAGKQNGKAVPVLINLPFNFGIKQE